MAIEDLIHEDDKPIVLRSLLLKHRRVNEPQGGFHFGGKRKFSSYTSLQVGHKFLLIYFHWEFQLKKININ